MATTARHGLAALLLSLALSLALVAVPPQPAGADLDQPDDPLWEDQWGPQQIRAERAWATATGANTTIAIVDSGIDHAHEDLPTPIDGTTFIAGCRSEDDRQADDDCDRDGDWLDGEDAGDDHGTHVAGIAAARTDNAVGIAGVAPDADLLAVKVLDSSGTGTFADVAAGIHWSAQRGADVINLSLGGLPGHQVLAEAGLFDDVVAAIEYAHEQGSLVVAAAGNDALPLCNEPAFRDGVVCVTATDRREAPAAYASWPNEPGQVGVAAPGGSLLVVLCGEGILSTVPAGEGIASCGYPASRAYTEYDGTSMAAPHVAGVGALLAEIGCERAESIDILTSTSRLPQTDERGVWDPRYGYGIVDAQAATDAAAELCAPSDERGDGDDGGRPAHAGPPENQGPPEDTGPPQRGQRPDDAGPSGVDEGLLTTYVTLLHIGR